MYESLNSAAKQLSQTVFSETYVMPLSTNTSIGRIIAAYLKPLYHYRRNDQMQRLSQALSQNYFLSTFAGITAQHFTSDVATSVEKNTDTLAVKEKLQKALVMTSIATMPAANATHVVTTEMKKQFIQYFNDTLEQGAELINALRTITKDVEKLKQEERNVTAELPAQLIESYQETISTFYHTIEHGANATQKELNISKIMQATLRSQIENTSRLDHVNNATTFWLTIM